MINLSDKKLTHERCKIKLSCFLEMLSQMMVPGIIALAMCLFFVPQSLAMKFSSSDAKTTGSLDLTLSYGAMWRVEDQDESARGMTDPNSDDGDRNFDTGLVSNLFKALGEFEVTHFMEGHTVGFFGRGFALYDSEIEGASNDHDSPITNNNNAMYGGSLRKNNEFTSKTEGILGKDIDFLDAFVYGRFFEATAHPFSFKLGWHLVNWGESTFITHGISSVMSHVDASKAALPGTELKEILLPTNQVSATYTLIPNLSLRGYYQFEHEATIFPVGNYFSDLDILVEGAENALVPIAALGLGLVPEVDASTFIGLDRTGNIDPDEEGQYGISLSWFAEALNETEFAVYYLNYHRKLPDLTLKGFGGEANATINIPQTDPRYWAIMGLDTSSYALTYFDDVKLFGLSFSTNLPYVGAFSGEVAYHQNIPMQTTNLGAGLGILGGLLASGVSNPVVPLSTREDLITAQVTFLQTLRYPSIADDITILAEVGIVHMPDLDDGEVFRGFDRCNKTSWGYKGMIELVYYNGVGKYIDALSGTDLITTLNFSHDVNGLSPIPAGSFTEDQKSIGFKVEAVWHSMVSASIGYNVFFGGGNNNILGDRDNITFSLKWRY